MTMPAASSAASSSRGHLARTLLSPSTSLLRSTCPSATKRRIAVPVALIHTSSPRPLPRALNRPPVNPNAGSGPSSSSAIPWFLQDQEVLEVDAPPPRSTATPATASGEAEDISIDPDVASLPVPLTILHTHLFRGPVAGMLHRPDALSFTLNDTEGEDSDPWVVIPARSLLGSTSWCDWVVIVTVRENSGGAINAKVAEEVGEVLRRVRPPPMEGEGGGGSKKGVIASLDDLLGPGNERSPFGPKSEGRGAICATTPSDGFEEGDDQSDPKAYHQTPSWATHRSSLRSKFSESPLGTSSWRPLKILSRETQHGLRALNASDPSKWNSASLSEHFKVSPEAVRRILRADPSRWGGEGREAGEGARRLKDLVEGKGDGRTREQREMDEIERLREEIEASRRRSDEGVEEDIATIVGGGEEQLPPATTPTAPATVPAAAPTRSPINVRSLGKPRHPVRFEGLPSTSASSRKRQARQAAAPSAGGDNGSGGEWVLVDAGWCVVHVMTPKARKRYDVEGVWREAERERRRNGGVDLTAV
ncbi:hypothetical protein BDZ90DRAFT_139930 [Jaminaea rosea]|uniref:Required for respiratory growth protein 9, mitochondrial n=1 Tax=Jaminaea rosea TaxID=1569628 RepID=A0A316UV90_9BASI|nr:hypothetical protein BDZ90DRAFT_139930 [Jaminaea rosea]PWN29142.1 hypothetical protein BDZ90DRAFT_139930 [Jaminaea rosea]